MTEVKLNISISYDEYDKIVNDAIVDQAKSLANEIRILKNIENPLPHNLQDLADSTRYLEAHFEVIRYNNPSAKANEIIKEIQKNHLDND
jgi:hypothetical protein